MRIGYYVQGDTDEAFIWGVAKRWCPDAELEEGRFRGSSGVSFRREIFKALMDLKDDKGCDILVVLTDADVNPWRDVKRREWRRVPPECENLALFGVADRNIECWLAIDRGALAHELGCTPEEIPTGDPSEFVKRRFGLTVRDPEKQRAKKRVRDFVADAPLRNWIQNSDSFGDFYRGTRRLAAQNDCFLPNELERS